MAKKSVSDRLDENMAEREKLDSEYFKESERLTTEWEKLMAELEQETKRNEEK